MIHNYIFNGVNDALPVLASRLLTQGDEFGSRAGRTLELMHVGITLNRPWQREIVVPERRANLAAQIFETMWVLGGRNDVAGLKHYLPRAADFSDDGATWRAGYGQRLRMWGAGSPDETNPAYFTDQLAYIVRTMQDSPGSRQAVVSLWDPEVDTQPGKDIACNNWLSFSSRKGYLDLHVGVRSNDFIWGWSGINTFEWSVLLEIVAGLAGLMVGSLHFSTTSFHIYDQHWERARAISRQDGNFLYSDSPRFDASRVGSLENLDALIGEWFNLEERIRTGQDVGLNVDRFPEPMLRSWLRVLQWYWSGEVAYLLPLRNTRLWHAAFAGVKPAGTPQEPDLRSDNEKILAAMQRTRPSFLEHVAKVHAEKHAAYGDSWKRRGEAGILGNIGRKADRLGSGQETSDETQFDTALDLLVYLAKYRCWLTDGSGDPAEVEVILGQYEAGYSDERWVDVEYIERGVDMLFTGDLDQDQKVAVVDTLLREAFILARSRY